MITLGRPDHYGKVKLTFALTEDRYTNEDIHFVLEYQDKDDSPNPNKVTVRGTVSKQGGAPEITSVRFGQEDTPYKFTQDMNKWLEIWRQEIDSFFAMSIFGRSKWTEENAPQLKQKQT